MRDNKKYILVRYGKMNQVGFFEHDEPDFSCHTKKVIVKTEKGLEMGSLVGPACHYKSGNFKMTPEQAKEYFTTSEIEFDPSTRGRLLRIATPDDISEERHLQKIGNEEKAFCQEVADEMGLDMQIIDVDHIFGGERIVFYFMADGRVDFRDMVKRLAHEYQTRIEMRQIGSRDEAKLFGDIETCGQECCCKKFLMALKPVNMRMAKMQKATLDPSKISGYCGRLKCCLRYEDQTYSDLKNSLPKRRTPVSTPNGDGRVLDGQILTQMIVVEMGDGTRQAFGLEDLKIIDESEIKPGPPRKTAYVRSGGFKNEQQEFDSENYEQSEEEHQTEDIIPELSAQPMLDIEKGEGDEEPELPDAPDEAAIAGEQQKPSNDAQRNNNRNKRGRRGRRNRGRNNNNNKTGQ